MAITVERGDIGQILLPVSLSWAEVQLIKHFIEEGLPENARERKSIVEKMDDYLKQFDEVEKLEGRFK